jgi:hypothetical protein
VLNKILTINMYLLWEKYYPFWFVLNKILTIDTSSLGNELLREDAYFAKKLGVGGISISCFYLTASILVKLWIFLG